MTDSKVITEPQEIGDTAVSASAQTGASEAQEHALSVKFNKETKNLTEQEAVTLAQKGMKFELIEEDFSRLRNLANKQKMSVPEYIKDLEAKQGAARREELLNQCGGNEALADRVLELEGERHEDDSLLELREYFPTVKSLDDLPRAVVESARLKGENLLNAYLRHRILCRRRQSDEDLFEKSIQKASIGSQKGCLEPPQDDFIKALWGR